MCTCVHVCVFVCVCVCGGGGNDNSTSSSGGVSSAGVVVKCVRRVFGVESECQSATMQRALGCINDCVATCGAMLLLPWASVLV